MSLFKKDKFPASYHSRQIISSDRISITYLGEGRFLYSIEFRNRLHFGRLDLYSQKKWLLLASTVLIFFTMHLMIGPGGNHSDDNLQAATTVQAEESETGGKADDSNKVVVEEAYQSGDAMRREIMGNDTEENDVSEFIEAEPETARPEEQVTTNKIPELDKNIIRLNPIGPGRSSSKHKAVNVNRYVVQKNDSISSIAGQFGLDKATVATAAGVDLYAYLSPGKTIYLPNHKGYFIKSRKGDTLARIAQKYKLDYEKFISINDLQDLDRLPGGKKLFLPDKKSPNLDAGWLLPTSSRVVNSGFGWRRYPRRAFHEGIDLRSRYQSVRAARSGSVIYAGWMGAYGKCVVIKHTNGYKTLYAHNSRLYVKRGQTVNRGQVISRSGNTGYSFGPHVHFEISRYGKHLNPWRFFRGLRWK